MILDTESTGNAGSHICQLSYLMVEGDYVRGENYYYTVRRMNPHAQEVHGLSVQMLRKLSGGRRFADTAAQVLADFELADVIVGHHLRCDIVPVEREMQRVGLALPERHQFCTLYNFIHAVGLRTKDGQLKHLSLKDLCAFMDVTEDKVSDAMQQWFGESGAAHDARYDCVATYLCLQEGIRRGLVNDLGEIHEGAHEGYLKYEMHAHTHPATPDAELTAGQVAEGVARAGYRALVVADHYNAAFFDGALKGRRYQDKLHQLFAGYRAASDAGRHLGLTVLPSVELTLEEGPEHFLLYGATEEILVATGYLCEMTLRELREALEPHGVLIIQAHPYRLGGKPLRAAGVDGVEIYNGSPRYDDHNEKAMQFAKKRELLMTCGSDIYRSEDIGTAFMMLPPVQDARGLAEMLRAVAVREPAEL